jgi:hypothetical protein
MQKVDSDAVKAFLHATWPNAMGVFLPIFGQNSEVPWSGVSNEITCMCYKEYVKIRPGAVCAFSGRLGPEGMGGLAHLQTTRFGKEMDQFEILAKGRLAKVDNFYAAVHMTPPYHRFKIDGVDDDWQPFSFNFAGWRRNIRDEITAANTYIRQHAIIVPTTALGRAIAEFARLCAGDDEADIVAGAAKVVQAAEIAKKTAEIEAKLAKYDASGDVADLAGLI